MRPRFDVAIDPETRRLIRGALVVEANGTITIRLPHRLESPNKLRGYHWVARHRDRDAWLARFKGVIADTAGRTSLAEFHASPIAAIGLTPVRTHRVVTLERQVPSARNFIRDTDNLTFSGKAVMDCLKRLQLIRDDASTWTKLVVAQRVSDDGRDWTVIRIEIPAEGQMPLMAEAVAEKVRQRR